MIKNKEELLEAWRIFRLFRELVSNKKIFSIPQGVSNDRPNQNHHLSTIGYIVIKNLRLMIGDDAGGGIISAATLNDLTKFDELVNSYLNA